MTRLKKSCCTVYWEKRSKKLAVIASKAKQSVENNSNYPKDYFVPHNDNYFFGFALI